MGLFTVGLRDDDFEPAYKFPALPHMVDAATDHTRTLSARYGKDGSEILVSRGEGKNPRRLTPRECARLMGYPDSFSIPVSDTQAYRQFGNSVAVPVIRAIGEAMKPYLSD